MLNSEETNQTDHLASIYESCLIEGQVTILKQNLRKVLVYSQGVLYYLQNCWGTLKGEIAMLSIVNALLSPLM